MVISFTIIQLAAHNSLLLELCIIIFACDEDPGAVSSETSHEGGIQVWPASCPLGILDNGAVVPPRLVIWSREKEVIKAKLQHTKKPGQMLA